jgi:gamma-glutamylcyclotransferase (GGCT)/AIG2-like uncharacterized protein YtfP
MKYIFGYGSLMNKDSLARTVPGPRAITRATLKGYQRKMNAPVGEFLYMNIVPNTDTEIDGVLIEVTEEEFELLKEREIGYEAVNIAAQLHNFALEEAIAFIAQDLTFPEHRISRSYLATCMRDLPDSVCDQWLRETIIENEIIDDLHDPQYKNSEL